ncbi:hypothetical protein CTAYLR_002265 [Chrysophaeum taylorii]|uniref:Uncharacterized protein n=1 Tax=Chrysophaeum taylorii TaxID=2483200 RepID=A0AAD7UPL7_9STRA|nr:hypothetical protein CTAYLR_002265 [Chrysophaeum taylorii]
MALSAALDSADVDYWSASVSSPKVGKRLDRSTRCRYAHHHEAFEEHGDEDEEESRWSLDWMSSEAPVARVLALALSFAVASRSLTGSTVFSLALFAADSRLRTCALHCRDTLSRFLGAAEPPPEQSVPRRTGDLARFQGEWTLDAKRSDSPVVQLHALGLPWAARVALARSPRTKRIRLFDLEWREITTTLVVNRAEILLLDGRPQTHKHPVDSTPIVVWTAVGARPNAAPPPHPARRFDVSPDAVVSIMYYERDASVATITRTIEDDGTYKVVNDLQVGQPKDDGSPPTCIVTRTYFRRR